MKMCNWEIMKANKTIKISINGNLKYENLKY